MTQLLLEVENEDDEGDEDDDEDERGREMVCAVELERDMMRGRKGGRAESVAVVKC